MTSGLLAEILDARGGLARWQQYGRVDATIVSGVGLKGALPFPVRSPAVRRVDLDPGYA